MQSERIDTDIETPETFGGLVKILMRQFAGACAVTGILFGAPAFAHHSQTMYDKERTVTIKGTIAEFRWVNPHCWVTLDVPNEQGEITQWKIEINSAVSLQRKGWTPGTLKPGKKLTLTFFPLRNGDNGGQFKEAVKADGKVLKD